MKERPILFSSPMVRALLAGSKTQTRRAVKPVLGEKTHSPFLGADGMWRWMTGKVSWADDERRCPYGVPGDRLWVREAWHSCPHCPQHQPLGYMAYRAGGWRTGTARSDDDARPLPPKCAAHGYKPSIHMKRHASRIDLEVTGVRVELVQDISEADAKAEGVMADGTRWRNYLLEREAGTVGATLATAKQSFESLWESINGAPSLAANPWVWAVEFRRLP